jgi:chromosomal replication initiation ATPase DnaA
MVALARHISALPYCFTQRRAIDTPSSLFSKRGKDNEPRKVRMYLAKEPCDMKLKEISAQFGTRSYGTVGWACLGVVSRIQADAMFRKRVSSIRRICQQ